jgi:hypothetical protein
MHQPVFDLIADDESPNAKGSLISMLPWRYADAITTVRHLRLNLYLPNPYDQRLWENTLTQQLIKFVQAVNNGQRMRDLKILIATWHHFHGMTAQQAAVLGILGQMHKQGHVQVKTRGMSGKLRAALQDLDLTDKMRDSRQSQFQDRSNRSYETIGRDMDWDWEGGILM